MQGTTALPYYTSQPAWEAAASVHGDEWRAIGKEVMTWPGDAQVHGHKRSAGPVTVRAQQYAGDYIPRRTKPEEHTQWNG